METFKKESKEELLAKAIKEYPIGTFHKGVSGSKYAVTRTPHFAGDNIYGGESGCIYHSFSNGWATIISKPEPEFILPEKWWIEVKSQEEFKAFTKWAVNEGLLNSMHSGAKYYTIPYYVCNKYYNRDSNRNASYNNTNIYKYSKGCKEITFKQFKKYVLKEDGIYQVSDNKEYGKDGPYKQYQISNKYFTINDIEKQLLLDYDKSDVKEIIECIKKIK